jgi:hypothetical protein
VVAGSFIAVFLLSMPSGAVGGTASLTSRTYTAPYSGVKVTLTSAQGYAVPCTTLSTPLAPHYDAKVGRAGFTLVASTSGCNRSSTYGSVWYPSDFKISNKFTAPTGWRNVSMNVTISWQISWNVTVPACAMKNGSHFFSCGISASASLQGAGATISHFNPNSTARIRHAGGGFNSFWNLTPSGRTGYSYSCTNFTTYNCSSGSLPPFKGVLSGTQTGIEAVNRSWLISSNRYYFNFDFFTYLSVTHSRGLHGTMTGGFARASIAVKMIVNSITVS